MPHKVDTVTALDDLVAELAALVERHRRSQAAGLLRDTGTNTRPPAVTVDEAFDLLARFSAKLQERTEVATEALAHADGLLDLLARHNAQFDALVAEFEATAGEFADELDGLTARQHQKLLLARAGRT